MREGKRPLSGILLDASCLLNLYATRRVEEILRAIRMRFGVVEAVVTEALYVRQGGPGEDADRRETVNLEPLITTGLLGVLRVETEEEAASYLTWAAQVDDGEAMTCALAIHRGMEVATDDRKAISVLRARAPHVSVRTTVELVKGWVEIDQLAPSEVKRVLMDIQERARFIPGRRDPLREWWRTQLERS